MTACFFSYAATAAYGEDSQNTASTSAAVAITESAVHDEHRSGRFRQFGKHVQPGVRVLWAAGESRHSERGRNRYLLVVSGASLAATRLFVLSAEFSSELSVLSLFCLYVSQESAAISFMRHL
jgi:hypothetical protein